MASTCGSLDAESQLHVFFVADQHVYLSGNLAKDFLPFGGASRQSSPKLGPVVQVERADGSGFFRSRDSLENQLAGGVRKRRKNSARVKPLHALSKDLCPIEVAGLQQGAGLVGAVVEDNRWAHTVAAVAVNGRDVGPTDAIVFEALEEGRHAHFANPTLDELANAIIDHRCGDARPQAKAAS